VVEKHFAYVQQNFNLNHRVVSKKLHAKAFDQEKFIANESKDPWIKGLTIVAAYSVSRYFILLAYFATGIFQYTLAIIHDIYY